MTDTLRGHPDDELRQEFLDEAGQTLQELDVALDSVRNGHGDEAGMVHAFRRAAMQFRGQAANLGMRPLSTVSHRLIDYLSEAPSPLPPRATDELQVYIDVMTSLLECKQCADVDSSAMVRTLPRKLGFNVGDIVVHNVEVMLVMPSGIQTRYVERELQQCGYRCSVVSDTLLALPIALQTKPDLIIISAIMPILDGIDLAIGLVSMPATRNIPLAVITSLDDTDERLHLLPRKVPVLHKGASFGDDLFKALDSLFLI